MVGYQNPCSRYPFWKPAEKKLSFSRFLQWLLYKKVLRKIVYNNFSVGCTSKPCPSLGMMSYDLRHVLALFDVCLKMGRPQVVAI